MGEITEALRRAKTEPEPRPRPGGAPARIEAPVPAPEKEATEPAQQVKIPGEEAGPWFGRAVHVHPHGHIAEHYRHFALRVDRVLKQRQVRSLMLTSAFHSEGKTTTACNLALALSSLAGRRRFALIDLDLRRPAVATALGIEPERGIEEVLDGRLGLSQVCVRSEIESLDIFPVKQATQDAPRLLAGPSLQRLLREATDRYDIVIIDSPPVMPVSDSHLIATHVQGWIAVIRAGVTRSRALREMMGALPQERLLGAFVNDSEVAMRSLRYTYGYGYGPDEAPSL